MRKDEETTGFLGISPAAWMRIGIIFALMAALFRFNLWRLWLKTNPISGEANWGHSVVVPFIGLYYLYIHRDEMLKTAAPRQRARSPVLMILAVLTMAFVVAGLALKYLDLYTGLVSRPLWMGVGGLAVASLLLLPLLSKGQWLSATVEKVLDSSALWFGGAMLLLGIVTFAYGIFPGQNDFVKDFGMVVTLFGVVLMLCSWHVMKTAWFPIFFLVCALPWPGLVYSWVAGPLQTLAADVAVKVLQITGVDAIASGTKITIARPGGLPPRTLNVAEACAGLRSLMTFISVGGAVAFLSSRPLWQKFIVMASAVPIAIMCNVTRVAGQGLLDYYVSQELSESFAHQFVGMIMLIPAFFLILLVGWCLDKIFIDEVDNKSALSRAGAGKLVVTPASSIQALPAAPPPPIRSVVRPGAAKLAAPARPTTSTGAVLPPLSPRAQAAQRRIKPPETTPSDVSGGKGTI